MGLNLGWWSGGATRSSCVSVPAQLTKTHLGKGSVERWSLLDGAAGTAGVHSSCQWSICPRCLLLLRLLGALPAPPCPECIRKKWWPYSWKYIATESQPQPAGGDKEKRWQEGQGSRGNWLALRALWQGRSLFNNMSSAWCIAPPAPQHAVALLPSHTFTVAARQQ